MPGIQRFVTYIYEYEITEGETESPSKKGNNVGFAKIEVRGKEWHMEVHLRGTYPGTQEGVLYLFRVENSRMLGFPVGKIQVVQGSGSVSIVGQVTNLLESQYHFQQMDGIVLAGIEGWLLMSRWKEGEQIPVNLQHFVPWEKEREQTTSSEGEPLPDDGMEAIPENKASQKKQGSSAVEAEPENKALQNMETSSAAATEVPQKNPQTVISWEQLWVTLQNRHPVYHPFEDPQITCVRMELKNLRELPQACWYLENNRFLIHSYYNYRFLILAKTAENRWILGVPGVYQKQERVMASVFGFADFMPEHRNPIGKSVDRQIEKGNPEPMTNRFGYWCHVLEYMDIKE